MAKIFLRKQLGGKIVQGHPWVFANQIGDQEGSYNTGDIVEVYSYSGSFIGMGFINPRSQIRVRLFTRKKEDEFNKAFINNKIQVAWNYRQKIGYTENCRVFFGDSDGLSGLIIDKFNDYFVVQTLSYGIDKYKNDIVEAINDIFSPKGIYERNDLPVRLLEGLPQQKGFLSASFETSIKINDHGLDLLINIANHTGNGYHLDRAESRDILTTLSPNSDVLDLFCGNGICSLIAARSGCRSVLGIDFSEDAVKYAEENAVANNLTDNCTFKMANAFDYLKQAVRSKKKFDIVILDPPSFTKGRDSIAKSLAAYKEINLRALQLLNEGGFLITSSSSALIENEQFIQAIMESAKDAKKAIRLITSGIQAADHPSLPILPTTAYYKSSTFQLIV